MKIKPYLLPVLISTFIVTTTASASWVAKSNNLQIDKQQIQSYLEFQQATLDQVPISKREQLLENWFIRESLVKKAKEDKLDSTEKYHQAIQEFRQDLLAKLALSKLSKKNIPDFIERAKEIYQAEKSSKYQFPEKLRVKQIILSKEKKQLADDIYQKLNSGELTFDKAVEQYSNEPRKYLSKGLSYWFNKGQKSNVFYQNANALSQDNLISKPFEDKDKLIILSFVDRKPAETKTFNDVKDEIISTLEQDYIVTERKVIIKKIKQDFAENMEINPEFLNEL